MQPRGEQVLLGSYNTYDEAQYVVDHLADHHFQVETTQIIGSDLRMVEQVTGRLTWPKAILSGMASGAWLGVFIGLLLSILSSASFLRIMTFGVLWGVLFGGIFVAVGYGLTRGRRDFTSRSAIVPSRFVVLVAVEHHDHARALLAAEAR